MASATQAREEVTPVQKVLVMLQDLLTKADAEKKEEEVKFAAFTQWCENMNRMKTDEITEGGEKINMLKAEIEKAESTIRQLTERVQELDEDVGRWGKDKGSATEVREKEASDYQATVQDYSESLAALDQAIQVLKKQAFDRQQEEALLQLKKRPL